MPSVAIRAGGNKAPTTSGDGAGRLQSRSSRRSLPSGDSTTFTPPSAGRPSRRWGTVPDTLSAAALYHLIKAQLGVTLPRSTVLRQLHALTLRVALRTLKPSTLRRKPNANAGRRTVKSPSMGPSNATRFSGTSQPNRTLRPALPPMANAEVPTPRSPPYCSSTIAGAVEVASSSAATIRSIFLRGSVQTQHLAVGGVGRGRAIP
jgi:hypothetical protein